MLTQNSLRQISYPSSIEHLKETITKLEYSELRLAKLMEDILKGLKTTDNNFVQKNDEIRRMAKSLGNIRRSKISLEKKIKNTRNCKKNLQIKKEEIIMTHNEKDTPCLPSRILGLIQAYDSTERPYNGT